MDLVAHIFGVAALINSVPHIVHGLSGDPFPTPFARPPGIGLSRPEVNVVWGAINLGVAWGLLALGDLRIGATLEGAVLCAVALAVGLALAGSAARSRARRAERAPPHGR